MEATANMIPDQGAFFPGLHTTEVKHSNLKLGKTSVTIPSGYVGAAKNQAHAYVNPFNNSLEISRFLEIVDLLHERGMEFSLLATNITNYCVGQGKRPAGAVFYSTGGWYLQRKDWAFIVGDLSDPEMVYTHTRVYTKKGAIGSKRFIENSDVRERLL